MAVTAIVRFTFPEPKSPEAAKAAFEASAPLYRGVRGLVRKYYSSPRMGGPAAASTCSTRARTPTASMTTPGGAGIRERLGAEPSIEYFESPVIVDNDAGAISTAA